MNLGVGVHPDKGGIGNIEEATRCTQKISKCFELAKEYILRQLRKGGFVPEEASFDHRVVDCSDIVDGRKYYSGFVFVPSIASHFCKYGRAATAADAAHCHGCRPQSYGTTYEVIGYDANHSIAPLLLAHTVGTESEESWTMVFTNLKRVPEFDFQGGVTIADQEKSIDCSFENVMEYAKLFLDPLHVKKNMLKALGKEKAAGIAQYERAVHAPSRSAVDAVKRTYGQKTAQYLSRFPDTALYRAYAGLQDLATSSQGAESQMGASIRNQIRSVEPQSMLRTVLESQRKSFLKRQNIALSSKAPVPPQIERHLASLIRRGRPYQAHATFLEGTDLMEATVISQVDGTRTRRVVLSNEQQKPPECCAYSFDRALFPCWHGTAVLCEKCGTMNLFKFIGPKNLTDAWKEQYEGRMFGMPLQADVDRVVLDAQEQVLSGSTIHIPVALALPRGRPVQNAGKRMRSWYESVPTARKRSYHCSLCHLKGHTARKCELCQLFKDD